MYIMYYDFEKYRSTCIITKSKDSLSAVSVSYIFFLILDPKAKRTIKIHLIYNLVVT